jgi:hypothetical protein
MQELVQLLFTLSMALLSTTLDECFAPCLIRFLYNLLHQTPLGIHFETDAVPHYQTNSNQKLRSEICIKLIHTKSVESHSIF